MIKLVQTGSNWIKLDPNRSNLFKLIYACPKWSNLFKLVQTWSNLIKVIKLVQTWSTIIIKIKIGFLAVMAVWQKLLFGQKYFFQNWSAFFARNCFFQMNLPYLSKYWKVWLAFDGWKLSGLFTSNFIVIKNLNYKNGGPFSPMIMEGLFQNYGLASSASWAWGPGLESQII